MIDALKDYLAPKRFGVVAYICLIVHFLSGLTLTAVTSALRAGEIGKFSCSIGTQATAAYKTYVEKTCYSRYEQTYNSPLPLYGFVLLSIGITVIISVIYSLGVRSSVENVDSISDGSDDARIRNAQTNSGFRVFYFYFFHLVARSLLGILFTVLQHTLLYPRGFDFEFSCYLSTTGIKSQTGNNTSIGKSNITSIACENSTASEKQLWSIVVSMLNSIFALITLGEVIYLIIRRFVAVCSSRFQVRWTSDSDFIINYLLRKQYRTNAGQTPASIENIALISHTQVTQPDITSCDIENTGLPNTDVAESTDSSDADIKDSNSANCGFQEVINISKRQVLKQARSPDISYAPQGDLNDMYIDLVIHTGRAPHNFPKAFHRHEIYDVYMSVPKGSIRLEAIKDLFYPNRDTHGKIPRTILAVGRPGIGKTVLTEKIIRDWANESDGFYAGKIAFFFKFRWFDFDELKNLSLAMFLRYGTGLSEEKFEIIMKAILKEPKKAIFIFDGLDEYNGDQKKSLEESQMLPNDSNNSMSAMTLFIKLAYGTLLPGATVLVTSRPTADHFYSKLNFDRVVEILGFTSDKIEEYVNRFCDNIRSEGSDLQPVIWNHINSSSDLLNLCYIPVNCFIICVTLSACLSDPKNNTGALPTTLTELYDTAVDHFAENHNHNCDDENSLKQTLKNIQELAFEGMKRGQLVFNKNVLDEQMKKSGLVHSLSNPIFPLRTEYCFIHLTIQEFLAAKHVTERLSPEEIEQFIATHINNGTWHLVLQFIAGLLSEKINRPGGVYDGCWGAFTKGLTLSDGTIILHDNMHVIKCLKEVNDEKQIEKVCCKTNLNTVTKVYDGISGGAAFRVFSVSEWAAVAFVCKHLKNMKHFRVDASIADNKCLMQLANLLRQMHLEVLKLHLSNISNAACRELEQEQLIKALMKPKCALNLEHRNLRSLTISFERMTDACVSGLCELMKSGYARHLAYLNLTMNGIFPSAISQLCEVLNDTNCMELTSLDLSFNEVGDKGARMLCNVLKHGQLSKLNELSLENCLLTKECILYVCETLRDEHCQLKVLVLTRNSIGDEGLHTLCTSALRNEQCMLTTLDVGCCSLTDDCVQCLCETLKDVNCKVLELYVRENSFTEQSKRMLRDVEGSTRICKVRDFRIDFDYCAELYQL